MTRIEAHGITDRADLHLRAGGRVAMTLPELAGALAYDPARLGGLLRDDPRFLVLDRQHPLPGIDVWAVRERTAYAAALRHLDQPPLVMLRDAAAGHPAGVADMLHRTVVDLIDARDTTALARAAEEVRAALAMITPPAAAAPSTSRPPGPPPPG